MNLDFAFLNLEHLNHCINPVPLILVSAADNSPPITHTCARTHVLFYGERHVHLAYLRRPLGGPNTISYQPAKASLRTSGHLVQILMV